MKREIYCFLITGLVFSGILSGAYALESKAETSMLKRVIKMEAERGIVHYQKESFWDERSFYEILNSKADFEAKQLNSFQRNAQKYGRKIVNPKVEFDESKKATLFLCDVEGTKQGNWYDFDWFLRPLGLDFLDSHFQRKDKELRWGGKVRGVKTEISIRFPYSISNCHEHVWKR